MEKRCHFLTYLCVGCSFASNQENREHVTACILQLLYKNNRSHARSYYLGHCMDTINIIYIFEGWIRTDERWRVLFVLHYYLLCEKDAVQCTAEERKVSFYHEIPL